MHCNARSGLCAVGWHRAQCRSCEYRTACFAWALPDTSFTMRSINNREEQSMSDTMTTNPAIRNGVDTATLFATIDAIKGDPELAKFQFRASNRWIAGTHSQSTMQGFFGARQEMHHAIDYRADAD